MNKELKKELLNFLLSFVTEHRKKLFNEVIKYRTRYITIVLEDIYQPHNASATLRTSEIYGIQDVHIIEQRNKYSVNPDVALGASKWINIIKQSSTNLCYKHLKENGYKIYATIPYSKKAVSLFDLPLNSKIALVFGNELEGLSESALNMADGYVKIPMYGFTESFNISVSVAIFLSHLTERLRRTDIKWQLSDDEKLEVLLQWTKNSIKKSELLVKEFLNKNNNYEKKSYKH